MRINDDIFIIKSKRYDYIVYSPLKGSLFSGNEKAIDIVRKYMYGEKLTESEFKSDVYKYLQAIERRPALQTNKCLRIIGNSLTIILTQMCNLGCTYCYAQKQHSTECLDQAKIKISIDYYVANSIDKKNKRIVFIGGGEPTIAWGAFEYAIEYIRGTYENLNIACSLITNGTLLTTKKLEFLKKHRIKVVFSFDILPEIQNNQRGLLGGHPTFNLIDKNIKKAYDIGVDVVGIRSTITTLNVKLMQKMVYFVSQNYPQIKLLNFEPVSSDTNTKSFYDDYIENFFISKKLATECGIILYNSLSISCNTLKERFCQREFCVTPTGSITTCHRISSSKEPLYDSFTIGYVSDTNVNIDEKKVNTILSLKQPLNKCKTCFAKYHCAGGCVSERMQLTKEQKEIKCIFTKEIILKLLENQVEF